MSSEARSEIFVCEIKQIQTLTEKGTMGSSYMTELMSKHYGRVIWNTASGDLRIVNKDGSESKFRREMKLIYKGDQNNSALGISIVYGSASTVLTTIRVYTWQPKKPFILDGDEMITGTCDRIS
jgi:hypothetical protein